MSLTCTFPTSERSYNIEIGSGLLEDHHFIESFRSYGAKFAIITGETIAPLYANPFCERLKREGYDAHLFSFPGGEDNKSRETKARLEDQLLERSFGRDTCIIAIGGGVVTDIAGFLAATFCRGVPLITIPTTLLAMVDASIGGKTGVNTPFGKNLVGAIYQPKKVIIDTNTLKTLPIGRFREGVVEMIKHGLIADRQYFEFLEKHAEQLLKLDQPTLEKGIYESCKIKREIVEEDEKEVGKRRLLNFGHTLGHAIEKLTHYSVSHGEAVAVGIIVESHVAVQLGHLSQESLNRIVNILNQYGLPLKLPKLDLESLLKAMILDKKSVKGRPRFVILKEMGQPLPFNEQYCTEIEPVLIERALNWFRRWIL